MSSKGRLSIEVIGGHSAPAELPSSGRLSLGSSEKAGYWVEGQGVAGVHCTIGRIKGGGWALKDLGSEYGTFVNGKRVESVRLRDGDTILIGSTRLRIFDPSRGGDAAPPSSAEPKAERVERASAPTESPRPETRASAPPAERRRAGAARFQVDGYRIEDRLGLGGMGEVYLAEQTRLGRKVALKVLSPKLEADAAFVRDFQAEARSAAALNHPNVVTVYDVGESEGHHYLSMEYMSRGCLESRLGKLGPIPWREVLRILRDAAAGLVYAESRGIVHRDIKPANLMQNEDGVTKLADLGLAVQAEKESVREEGRKIVGTPHFIAPELIRGGTADSRSDLYSLGATAYRLLSGHTPFEGATNKEILRGALRDEPAPLAERVDDVPPALADLVHRLLAKDPAERPASAQVLLDALNQLANGGPSAAPARRKSPLVPLLVGVAILAGGGFAALKLLGGEAGAESSTDSGSGRLGGGETTVTPPKPTIDDLAIDEDTIETTGEGDAPAFDPRVLEADATIAYYALEEQTLSREEKIVALRDLATKFDGTDIATRARGEADELERVQREGARAEAERQSLRGDALAKLTAAAALDADPAPPVGNALGALAAIELAPELFLDESFTSERSALFAAVVERGEREARATLAEIDQAAERGEFEHVQEGLTELVQELTLPGFTEAPPADLGALRQLASDARTRLDGLDERRKEFAARMARVDREQCARSLHGGGELERELRAFDLAAAIARLEGLEGRLRDDALRGDLRALTDELRLAQGAFSALGRAWGEGSWQRTMVADPRERRSRSAEAVGADERGVTLKDAGSTSHVGWDAWGARPRELYQLFKSRLERGWTRDEAQGIAAALRVSATLAALDPLLEAWRDDGLRLSERELEKALEVFEEAREWVQEETLSAAALEAEREAAELVGQALIAAQEGSPSFAVDALERLLGQYEDTLVVRLLSDGSEWRVAVLTASASSADASRETPGDEGPDATATGSTGDKAPAPPEGGEQ